jgi:AcrR family transcriptional regulator
MVPKLWSATVAAHRRSVSDAILETTARLVAEHGVRSVTMSQVAHETGIGRATLYKYFPDVEAILLAWHERQITRHLDYLAEVRDRADGAGKRLEAVLEAFAMIVHESRRNENAEISAHLHRHEHVAQARQQLRKLVRDLLNEGVESGDVRGDVAPDELATFCLHALGAASGLSSRTAVRRLVSVTLAGVRT